MPNYESGEGAKQYVKKYQKDYVIPQRVKDIAKKINVKVLPSRNHLKKIDVFSITGNSKTNNRLLAQIGGRYQDGAWYGDYPTYLKRPVDRYGNKIDADERKRLYLARHSHEKKTDKSKSKWNKGKLERTPSYYADTLLWS
tara:strand:- start:111 stop:533 length:423 start_codon:yes stop_codon:yes gene_type:complete